MLLEKNQEYETKHTENKKPSVVSWVLKSKLINYQKIYSAGKTNSLATG